MRRPCSCRALPGIVSRLLRSELSSFMNKFLPIINLTVKPLMLLFAATFSRSEKRTEQHYVQVMLMTPIFLLLHIFTLHSFNEVKFNWSVMCKNVSKSELLLTCQPLFLFFKSFEVGSPFKYTGYYSTCVTLILSVNVTVRNFLF